MLSEISKIKMMKLESCVGTSQDLKPPPKK